MTFFLDADIPLAVRRSIAQCRTDTLYAGGPGDAPPTNTPDEVWLPLAGANDWTVISRDQRIRYKPAEKAAVIDNGVRMFVLSSAGNMTRWDALTLITASWARIEAVTDPGPYIYYVTRSGISRKV